MTMPRREKIVLSTLASVGIFLAMLIAGPPDAGATPLSYVQALNARGIVVYDVEAAVDSGYRMCDRLAWQNGGDVVLWVYGNSSFSDVPTVSTAYNMVESAVEELCPQHDHRDEGMTYS